MDSKEERVRRVVVSVLPRLEQNHEANPNLKLLNEHVLNSRSEQKQEKPTLKIWSSSQLSTDDVFVAHAMGLWVSSL